MSRYVLGITGASGSILAFKLMGELLRRGHEVHAVITRAGLLVIKEELDLELAGKKPSAQAQAILERLGCSGGLTCFDEGNLAAPIASGSYPADGMIVAPCSMGSAAAIAQGASQNLLERAADVTIKEGRKFIVVPRETPLSRIHLKNLLLLAEYGALILPPMPAFYARPMSMDEALDYFIGRVLSSLGIPNELMPVWTGLQ